MKLSRSLTLRRDQIWVLIAKDFKLKYNSTALGFLWSLLVPAFTSIVYYFVFGIMMRFDAPNYFWKSLSAIAPLRSRLWIWYNKHNENCK